ncbi:MAG TPA: hypothetical protein VFV86_09465 [Nitrososphaeraceae archaeon]|nr:hypothetical protein [Nitrososphaeraceae archaeon]
MTDFNQNIFGKKSFSDLLKDVYDNSKKTEKQITELIASLAPMITNPGEAMIIVPLLKEYFEVKVKNDEHLVKMAAVVQRALASKGDGDENSMITEAEKEALLQEVQNIYKESKALPEKIPNEN